MKRRRLTPLQRTLLRWLDLLGSVGRTPTWGWTRYGGFARQEMMERWMLPVSLEQGSRLRCFDDQAHAMRRAGYVRMARGRLTLTDRGSEALRGPP